MLSQTILLKIDISLLPTFSHVEIQRKLEQEQQLRKTAEERLLEVEKAKSTVSFDYKQVQQQLQSLQSDLRNETEKVSKARGFYVFIYEKLLNCNQTFFNALTFTRSPGRC